MKNHLKRIAVPKTWVLGKKESTFVTRPTPGAHAFENGLPLGFILRDCLNLAETMSETKKLLNNNEVLIDGKRRKDNHYLVGLFDILSIPSLNKYYQIIFNEKSKLEVVEIKESESKTKLCKVLNKSVLPTGKIQLNLSDGKNIFAAGVKAKVGDTLVLTLPKLEVKEVLPLQKGAHVYIIKGKSQGDFGTLKEIKEGNATYLSPDGKELETTKAYLFVVNKDQVKRK